MIVYSVIFLCKLACSVNPWPSLLCNNLLGHCTCTCTCTCTAIILAYKIMCSQDLYVSGIHVAG